MQHKETAVIPCDCLWQIVTRLCCQVASFYIYHPWVKTLLFGWAEIMIFYDNLFNPISTRGGLYDPLINYCFISKKITIKDVFEIIWLFLKWFQHHFKKDLRSIGCIDKFLWWFEIAWSQNLLSRFSEDSGEMRIWLSGYKLWNVCHFFVFEPRNLIFSIKPYII